MAGFRGQRPRGMVVRRAGRRSSKPVVCSAAVRGGLPAKRVRTGAQLARAAGGTAGRGFRSAALLERECTATWRPGRAGRACPRGSRLGNAALVEVAIGHEETFEGGDCVDGGGCVDDGGWEQAFAGRVSGLPTEPGCFARRRRSTPFFLSLGRVLSEAWACCATWSADGQAHGGRLHPAVRRAGGAGTGLGVLPAIRLRALRPVVQRVSIGQAAGCARPLSRQNFSNVDGGTAEGGAYARERATGPGLSCGRPSWMRRPGGPRRRVGSRVARSRALDTAAASRAGFRGTERTKGCWRAAELGVRASAARSGRWLLPSGGRGDGAVAGAAGLRGWCGFRAPGRTYSTAVR